jgi:hypothetical protein
LIVVDDDIGSGNGAEVKLCAVWLNASGAVRIDMVAVLLPLPSA